MPKVTVLMPVFNGELYVREAIDSVLRQTFQDFELLIMDDGSTDRTLSIIREYKDRRIRLELREHDFIGNLNEGIRLAQGKYIARMDADDIMNTERLWVQVKLMDEHPEYAVSGSWLRAFGKDMAPQVMRPFSGEIVNPLLQMLKGNVLFHPTIIFRKNFFLSHHIQYQNYLAAEDYKLYSEIAKAGGIFYVEPQVLLFYRCSPQQVTSTKHREMLCTSLSIREEVVEYLLTKYQELGEHPKLLYLELKQLEGQGLLGADSMFRVLYELFANARKQRVTEKNNKHA